MVSNLFDLTGKTALVTGGSKGLGKAMARGMAEAGADVVISSRHENELRIALDEILKDTGRRGRYVVADMSRREQVVRLAKDALELTGRIDILINNAGIFEPKPFAEIPDAHWDRFYQVNVMAGIGADPRIFPADAPAQLGTGDFYVFGKRHSSPRGNDPLRDDQSGGNRARQWIGAPDARNRCDRQCRTSRAHRLGRCHRLCRGTRCDRQTKPGGI